VAYSDYGLELDLYPPLSNAALSVQRETGWDKKDFKAPQNVHGSAERDDLATPIFMSRVTRDASAALE